MTKTSYEKEGLNSLNELFEKLIVCSEKQDKESTMRIVSSLNEEEKDYLYTWASEQGKLDKVAGIVVKAEMDKKAFDINCRFKKQVLEALPTHGYCLENDPANPDSFGNYTIKFTDNKYINGEIRLTDRKVDLEARDAENKKYEKTIDYSEIGDLMESINHFQNDIKETFKKKEVVVEETKEEPFDILNDPAFMKQIGAEWVSDLIKKKAGTSNFWDQEGYPLIAFYYDSNLAEKDFVEYWNENNPDEPIKNYEDKLEEYYNWKGEEEIFAAEEMKNAIASKDIPYGFKIELKPGYYESVQLFVEDNAKPTSDYGTFEDFITDVKGLDYGDISDEESDKYYEEYKKYCEDAYQKDKQKVIQIMEELKDEQGWVELGVAYRFSNGETGYTILDNKSASTKLTLNKIAFVNEDDGVLIMGNDIPYYITYKFGNSEDGSVEGELIMYQTKNQTFEDHQYSENPLDQDQFIKGEGEPYLAHMFFEQSKETPKTLIFGDENVHMDGLNTEETLNNLGIENPKDIFSRALNILEEELFVKNTNIDNK